MILPRGRVAFGFALLFGASGCPHNPPRNQPGTSYGEIRVSSPRISGRERLINDRLEQERWLTVQLQNVDRQTFGYSGLVDMRSLAFQSFQAQAQIDPSYGVYRLQQERNTRNIQEQIDTESTTQQFLKGARQKVIERFNRGEISAADAKAELEKLGVSIANTNVSTGTTTPDKPTAPPGSVPSLAAQAPASAVFAPSTGTPTAYTSPSGGQAQTTSLGSSPIESFLDRNAVREEIRNLLLETGLDDAHDIAGNTLYRLTFDATLLPLTDTSAWAMIEMEAKIPHIGRDDADQILRRLIVRLDESLNDEIRARYNGMRNALEGPCSTKPTMFEAFTCAVAAEYVGISSSRALVRTLDRMADALKLRTMKFSKEYTQPLVSLVVRDAILQFERTHISCYFEAKERESAFYLFALTTRNAPLVLIAPAKQREAGPERDLQLQKRRNAACESSFDHADALAKILNGRSRVAIYAVTPRETVQRVSELGAAKAASELLLGLSAVTGQAGITAAMQSLQQNEALYQAIRRQPLVVGYGSKGAAKNAEQPITFGWLLGPQFRLAADGKSTDFRHVVKQQPVSVVLSLPAWAPEVSLKITTRWKREDTGQTAPGNGDTTLIVPLPARQRALDQMLTGIGDDVRGPHIDVLQKVQATIGERARVLVRGKYLWRSPEVYIGAQKADSVAVLPDMEGIVAEFRPVEAPNGVKSQQVVDLRVFTSEGTELAGHVILDEGKTTAGVVSQGIGRRLIAGAGYSLTLDRSLANFAEVSLAVRSPKDATLNVVVAGVVSRDGRQVSFSVDSTSLPKVATGDLLDLALLIKRSPGGAPETVPVGSNLVYFKSAEEARPAAAFVGQSKTLPLTVQIRFPKPVLEGFNALANARVTVRGTVTLDDADPVDVTDTTCQIDNSGACSVRIDATKEGREQINASAKTAPKLSLGFREDDSPTINPATLTLSR